MIIRTYLSLFTMMLVGSLCIQAQAQTRPTPTLQETGVVLQRQLKADITLRVRNTQEAIERHIRERTTIEANRRLLRDGKTVPGFIDLLPEEEDALNSMEHEYAKHQKRLTTLNAVHDKLAEMGNFTAMQQLEKALKKENERHDRKLRQLQDKRAKAKGKKDNPGLKKGHDKKLSTPDSALKNKAQGVGKGQSKGKNKGNAAGKGKGK